MDAYTHSHTYPRTQHHYHHYHQHHHQPKDPSYLYPSTAPRAKLELLSFVESTTAFAARPAPTTESVLIELGMSELIPLFVDNEIDYEVLLPLLLLLLLRAQRNSLRAVITTVICFRSALIGL